MDRFTARLERFERPQPCFQLRGARQGAAERLRHPLVRGDADRALEALECVLGYQAALGLAEDQADGGLVVGMAEVVVHGGEVEAHLTRVLGQELPHLELHDYIAAQPQVVEEEVEEEVLTVHLQEDLGAHQGEAGAQFQQEVADLGDQSPLQIPLGDVRSEAEEVEDVRVLEGLAG